MLQLRLHLNSRLISRGYCRIESQNDGLYYLKCSEAHVPSAEVLCERINISRIGTTCAREACSLFAESNDFDVCRTKAAFSSKV